MCKAPIERVKDEIGAFMQRCSADAEHAFYNYEQSLARTYLELKREGRILTRKQHERLMALKFEDIYLLCVNTYDRPVNDPHRLNALREFEAMYELLSEIVARPWMAINDPQTVATLAEEQHGH